MDGMKKRKGYLLVVEDVPDIRNLLDTTLSFKGYRVVTAANGEEALEMINKEAPAVVITDILMPRMDGFSLAHRLRLNPHTRRIPIIFISATYVAPEDKSFALTIGATRFIEKPIVIEEFLAMIEELLEKPVAAARPIGEREFYTEYRTRLKMKLAEKDIQITRAENLLENVSEAERETFSQSLHQTRSERKEILRLLEEVDMRLKEWETT